MVFYKSEGAMDAMWQEYGMEELEKGMQKLFPASRISVAELMGQLLQGDVLGAAGTLLQEVIQGMGASAAGRKNIHDLADRTGDPFCTADSFRGGFRQTSDCGFKLLLYLSAHGSDCCNVFPGFWEPQERRWKISCCL